MKVKKQKVSPRQKMINLMYVLLMAMLALNVSSDVLNGFTLVDESLSKSSESTGRQNDALYDAFEMHMQQNPEKVREWYERACEVREMSDSIYNLAERLKVRIAKKADGEEGDVKNLKNREDLEAATQVMLNPVDGEGNLLYDAITEYRTNMLEMTNDSILKEIIKTSLSTDVPQRDISLLKNWQEYHFESMPAIAAITLLTKIQNDVHYVEGEVLHSLANNIDMGDVRVNQIQALVIPTSRNVVRGSEFSAQIILAAVDSTQRPQIFIDDKPLESKSGEYSVQCNKTGDYTLNGYMLVNDGGGMQTRYDFSQNYTVVEPTATVSASLMNVLYAGFSNPVSISVPGVAANRISASITNGNGTIKSDGKGGFIVTPTKVGEEVKIGVAARNEDGKSRSMGEYAFRVRQLPDPMPFIEYSDKEGNTQRYRGGAPFSKQSLMSTNGIVAAIDDGLLNIGFKVLSFETVFYDNMGNAIPLKSQGELFSQQQKDMFRNLGRGKRFYISHVRAIGPDNIERLLPTTLEVIIN
ncbi:MAG: gliding motility protein GldM [Bacteroidaceae bacterium]|nr:gliding motility protein GldM [Bacteroidaceae bacterium]